jgi:molecular chaperone Hsp33
MAGRRRDDLTPFVLDGAAVRGALVRLDTVGHDIVAAHRYPPALARAIVELVAASTLLASTLKLDGSLLIQLAGDGPVRLAVVECTGALDLRATAQWDADRTERLGEAATLADLAGGEEHARLTLTLDQKHIGTLYQGIVALAADDVAGLIEHYLATSEQLTSRLVLATRDGIAAGLLLQRMPASGVEDNAIWARLSRRVAAFPAPGLLDEGDAAAVLTALFPDDDLRVFAARPARFRCSCSRERVDNALRIAGRDEIEAALAERGAVEVTCEFCHRRYAIAPAEARALFPANVSAPGMR